MSDKNRSDGETEKPRHPLLKTGDATRPEGSESNWPDHAWDTAWLDEAEISPIDIAPGQGSLLGSSGIFPGPQQEIRKTIEALSATSEVIKSQLWRTTHGTGIDVHELPVGKVRKFSLGSEEDASRSEDAAEQQVEEIRSALRESRRLGESSERRLEELRQRRPSARQN
jgi:hypothetical protein